MAYKNHLPTCIFKAQIEKHLKRSAVDASLKNEKIRYLSIQLLNQCQSYREKCYIKIDPKYPDRWNESLEYRALDKGKGKLFKEVIL